MNNLTALTQILDSAFPSGAFIHSFGLEAHIGFGVVNCASELEVYLKNIVLDQYQKLEFPIAKSVYQQLAKNALAPIVKIDVLLSSMLTFSYAKAYKTIGENILAHIKSLPLSKDITKRYFDAAIDKITPCNEIVLLSVFACDRSIDIKIFLALWCKKNLTSIALSALKISKIKPSDIQRILFSMDDFLSDRIDEALNAKALKIANFNPLFDEVVYRHKLLESKMFAT
ncbi:MAG: urease [Helicobacteraceae bacterium]|nr:urease [Helicobacteraceae bacterium]